jgi:hypothetical protein
VRGRLHKKVEGTSWKSELSSGPRKQGRHELLTSPNHFSAHFGEPFYEIQNINKQLIKMLFIH